MAALAAAGVCLAAWIALGEGPAQGAGGHGASGGDGDDPARMGRRDATDRFPAAPDGAATPTAVPWLSSATTAIAGQRAALVARLAASHDPADALRLFALLDDCREVREGRSHDPAPCDGISDAALAGRAAALERAVDGRARGAVARLYEAGPDGDGLHDPDNRSRLAWRARLEPLLRDAIAQGDIPALGAAMLEYDIGIDFPRDPVRALTYFTVALQLERAQGRNADGLVLHTTQLAAELTPQQRAVALAAAERLFADAFQGKPAQ